MQLSHRLKGDIRHHSLPTIPSFDTTKSRAKPHLRRVPLTSVARTYPARTTQDSHRYILKCITTSESAPSLQQYNTITQITQHKTNCCYVITLAPYTRAQQLAKRHAASICDCSKLTTGRLVLGSCR